MVTELQAVKAAAKERGWEIGGKTREIDFRAQEFKYRWKVAGEERTYLSTLPQLQELLGLTPCPHCGRR